MIQAMYSGISGLKAFKSSLDVIGNNIANVNTIGYKSVRTTFKEMLTQTMAGATAPSDTRGGTNPNQVGLGVMVGSTDTNNSQGSMQATGRQTDLAIEGNGFFALGDGSRKFYTRDGSFALDGNNNLVSASTGLKVLGWKADPSTGIIDTNTQVSGDSSIPIPIGLLSTARQTSKIDLGGNLDASAQAGDTPWTVESYAYDSLGMSHKVTVTFKKTANAAEWDYTVGCPDQDPLVALPSGKITFDASGHSELPSVTASLKFAVDNGSTQPYDVKIEMGSLNQFKGKFTADQRSQDGLQLGTLDSFTIGRDGVISGNFTNGSSRPLGQVAVAEVNNPAGMNKIGNNLLAESPNSGIPQLGIPGAGSRGMISAGFLEASNVDLANEFANMIVAQRGFQANSRIITTSDEVLQELVSMKR